MKKTNTLPTLIERIDLTDSGCWEWQGSLNRYGYGKVNWDGKSCGTHRIFYGELVGKIPEGLVIDHLCRNRKCCNPFHMEPVTNAENVIRGESGLYNRKKTHCPKGHEYIESNVITNEKGHRKCLTCHRELNKEWQRKNRRGDALKH